jgi:putative acetyltransferase
MLSSSTWKASAMPTDTPSTPYLRPAQPQDRDAIIALIDEVLSEYGDRLSPDGADRDLRDIDGYYVAAGGMFIVLEDTGRIRGTHAVLPAPQQPGVCVFRRLYLDPGLRGGLWGLRLMQWTLHWAREHGMHRIEFWSDTRFDRAHRFFARFGFQRDGRIRTVEDGWLPYQEYFYFLDAPFPDNDKLC